MLTINNLVGVGAIVGGFGPATTAFSCTLDTDLTGQENNSQRVAIPLSTAGTQIRVKFRGSSAGSLTVDNASVGIRNSVVSTVATPVELLFSDTGGGVGGHGFTVTAGNEIWSDWLDFVQSAQTVVVVQDIGASNGNVRYLSAAGTSGWYARTSYNSYNEAAPASFTISGGTSSVNINAIEVRSAL